MPSLALTNETGSKYSSVLVFLAGGSSILGLLSSDFPVPNKERRGELKLMDVISIHPHSYDNHTRTCI